jgi:PAS domain S-box-containing protein
MNAKTSFISQTLLIILFLVTTLAIGLGYWKWQQIKSERFRDLASTGSFLTSFYQLSFYQRELGLVSIGERLLSITGPNQQHDRLEIAKNAINVHEEFLAIGLVDTTGQLITFTGSLNQSNLPNLASSEKTKRTFEQVKRAKQIVIGEAYFFDAISDWIVPIRVPLRNMNGDLLAVNTSAISIPKLLQELESFQLNPQYKVHLVNANFNTIQLQYPLAKNRYDSVLHRDASIFNDKRIEGILDSITSFTAHSSLDKAAVIGVQTPTNSLNHYVVVTAPRRILFDAFKQGLLLMLVIYISLVVSLLFIFRYLRRKELRYRDELEAERSYSNNIIQSTSALIVGINTSGLCTFINPSAESITGYSKEEIIGKSWWSLLYPGGDYQQVVILKQRTQQGEVRNHEMTLTTKQGEKRLISWNSIRLQDKRGEVKEIIGIGIDVTEQHEAKRVTLEREANLKSIVESTTNIIGLLDVNLNLVEFNKMFSKYFRIAEGLELYKGMPILDLINSPQTEVFRSLLHRSLRGEKVSKIIDHASKQGFFYFIFTCNPIRQGDKITGVSVFIQDITELRNTQNELKKYSDNLEELVNERSEQIIKAYGELQESNEQLKTTLDSLQKTQDQLVQSEKMASLGILSAGVGHEINNPLNFIKGGVNALAGHLNLQNEQVVEEVKPFIDIINEGVNRATAIVKGLSHFSRQSGKQDEVCDLHEILDNCLLILTSKLKHKATLEKDYGTALPTLIGNEGQLHQAILNILSNAEQAIRQNGIIRIKTAVENNQLSLTISDNGHGIATEHLARISDPFFTTKAPGEGTGLGLSITYKIIAEHNGKIFVKSELNRGTEFVLLFPI